MLLVDVAVTQRVGRVADVCVFTSRRRGVPTFESSKSKAEIVRRMSERAEAEVVKRSRSNNALCNLQVDLTVRRNMCFLCACIVTYLPYLWRLEQNSNEYRANKT